MLQEVIGNSIDVLLISERKLDASFPSSIREDIPSKLLNANTFISGTENLLIENNLHSKKWLVLVYYNPY